MSAYKVKQTPVVVRGSRFDPGQEVELTDEELNNIGADYFEPVEANAEPTPPAPPSGEGEGEGGQSETDTPPQDGGGEDTGSTNPPSTE